MADLTTNFDRAEFQRVSDRPLTPVDYSSARLLANKLEVMKRELDGVKIFLTSYIRTGSLTSSGKPSQHGDGSAIDAEPEAGYFTQRSLYDRLSALARAGGIGDFGQLIFYPFSDQHFHLSLGTRREILISDAEERNYRAPTAALVSQIPGSVVVTAGGLVLVGAAFLYLRGKA